MLAEKKFVLPETDVFQRFHEHIGHSFFSLATTWQICIFLSLFLTKYQLPNELMFDTPKSEDIYS